MIGLKICFNGAIWLIIPKLSLLPLLIWSTIYHTENSKTRATRIDPNEMAHEEPPQLCPCYLPIQLFHFSVLKVLKTNM